MVGNLSLPANPTVEDLRVYLKDGSILCKAINKVQPGSVPKVKKLLYYPIVIPFYRLWTMVAMVFTCDICLSDAFSSNGEWEKSKVVCLC